MLHSERVKFERVRKIDEPVKSAVSEEHQYLGSFSFLSKPATCTLDNVCTRQGHTSPL